jgi:hypothetical protein
VFRGSEIQRYWLHVCTLPPSFSQPKTNTYSRITTTHGLDALVISTRSLVRHNSVRAASLFKVHLLRLLFYLTHKTFSYLLRTKRTSIDEAPRCINIKSPFEMHMCLGQQRSFCLQKPSAHFAHSSNHVGVPRMVR